MPATWTKSSNVKQYRALASKNAGSLQDRPEHKEVAPKAPHSKLSAAAPEAGWPHQSHPALFELYGVQGSGRSVWVLHNGKASGTFEAAEI